MITGAAQAVTGGDIQAEGQAGQQQGGDKAASVPAALAAIRAILADGKAENIVVLDIAARSALADYMVIAAGTSARHLAALADRLAVRLKSLCGGSVRVEGLGSADWILLDAGDIIVHLFRPEIRAFYRLETMWEPVSKPPAAAEE